MCLDTRYDKFGKRRPLRLKRVQRSTVCQKYIRYNIKVRDLGMALKQTNCQVQKGQIFIGGNLADPKWLPNEIDFFVFLSKLKKQPLHY